MVSLILPENLTWYLMQIVYYMYLINAKFYFKRIMQQLT